MNQSHNGARILLILDLDETLVYATEAPLEHPWDLRVGPFFIYKRPHLKSFLQECARHFRLAVWSAGTDSYVTETIRQVVPADIELAFIWGRKRCVTRMNPETYEFYHVKDLKKVKRLGYPLAKTLIIDDTYHKVVRNYGNAIYIPAFMGERHDAVLPQLARYLASLADLDDVRRLEKRTWRTWKPPE